MITFAMYGFIGGVARALVGILKAMKKSRYFHFDHKRFWFTVIASGIIGVMVGLLMSPDVKLALVGGYAGTDVLEGLVKAKFKKW